MESVAEPFATRLEKLFLAGGVGAVNRAVESGHSGMPHEASLMEQPRLVICLEGRACFELKCGESVTSVKLAPRDTLFIASGRWVRARVRESYVSMGVVFYAASTRFYLMRGRPGRNAHPGTPVETHVVPAGLGEEGRALARMLGGPAPSVAGERFFHHSCECLLLLTCDLLAQPSVPTGGSKARFTWQSACDFMLEHLHRPLSRKDVARHLGIHPNHLSRLFAEFGNEPFAEFLLARRLERARLLLEDPRLNIAEVARMSGFGSANYFSRVFHGEMGRTPTHARRMRSHPGPTAKTNRVKSKAQIIN